MKSTLLSLLLLGASFVTAGKTYYLSAQGSDLNDGLHPASAWQTLARLQQAAFTLQAGDSILLARGSVFRGTLSLSCRGLKGSPVFIGAWGAGAPPVINGSVMLNGWERVSANLWRATWSPPGQPGDLFIQGVRQPLGRYPNEGYGNITGTLHGTSFSDSTLAFPDGYLKDAEVVVKSERWTIDRLGVLEYNNRTFRFLQRPSYPLSAGAGYFIQNHPATLDRNGEWCFNHETGELFLYSELDPGGRSIEASIIDNGLTITDGRYITVADIVIAGTRETGIVVMRSDDVVLDGVTISASGVNGLVVTDSQHVIVRNTRISDSHNNGIEWSGNSGGLLENNNILRTGLTPGRGVSGNGSYIGLSITGHDPQEENVFRNNTIDSTGYSAVDFRTGHTALVENTIRYFCLVKDDGGGIYTWGNSFGKNRVEGNTILFGRGNAEGTTNRSHRHASGIYIDDRSAHIALKQNTVASCAGPGILIHNASDIDIIDNRLSYNAAHLTNPERAQLLISRDGIVPEARGVNLGLKVQGNSFLTGEGSWCLYLRAEGKEDLSSTGSFTSNQYYATHPRNAIALFSPDAQHCAAPKALDLSQWKDDFRVDSGSTFIALPPVAEERKEKELVKNGAFTRGYDGWYIWPDQASMRVETIPGDGNVLKVRVPSGQALVYYAGVALHKDKTYRVTFSGASTIESRIELVVLQAHAPWAAVGPYTCFTVDSTSQTFTWFFRPHTDAPNARLNFKSTESFRLDNISLREIVAEEVDKRLHLSESPPASQEALRPHAH